jgi:predicted DNA-binding protein (MmcQ/YjbR family)
MKTEQFNKFCSGLPHAHHVVQWGGSDVWKVATKVFAIGSHEEGALYVSFKVSEMSFDILKTQAGLRPAPYLASRGMKWIQRTDVLSMNDGALKDYLKESHRIVSLGLTKKIQKELRLNQAEPNTNSKLRRAKP